MESSEYNLCSRVHVPTDQMHLARGGNGGNHLDNLLLSVGRNEVMAMIIGLGTDIVEIVRIGEMIERHGERFLQRVYTEEEIKYCQRHKEALQHYAGRWAAKEAVMKTLGTGFTKGVGWKDIQVGKTRAGRPLIQLVGGAAQVARQLGINDVLITISHCRAYATATAIAVQHSPRVEE